MTKGATIAVMDKPTIECVAKEITPDGLHYGKFVAEPLERGYGTTLGNALRRVLLSDLEGTAVMATRIEGVSHEFTAIPGVVEDVIEIILNLKGLVLRSYANENKTLRLEVRDREGAVTARDIQTDPEVEVLNPNWYLCTVEKDAVLEMELLVARDKGFVTAEKQRRSDLPIGMLPIDALYMPVRKVNFTVEDTRVGQSANYDKLILEVWTTGSIEPVKAVSTSANNLIQHFQRFAVLAGEPVLIGGQAAGEEVSAASRASDMSIEELELSVRAYNCLKRANIFTVGDLLQKTERELMEIKNFGRKSAEEVIERVKVLGFSLKPSSATAGDEKEEE